MIVFKEYNEDFVCITMGLTALFNCFAQNYSVRKQLIKSLTQAEQK